jgi:hypothetical protein
MPLQGFYNTFESILIELAFAQEEIERNLKKSGEKGDPFTIIKKPIYDTCDNCHPMNQKIASMLDAIYTDVI